MGLEYGSAPWQLNRCLKTQKLDSTWKQLGELSNSAESEIHWAHPPLKPIESTQFTLTRTESKRVLNQRINSSHSLVNPIDAIRIINQLVWPIGPQCVQLTHNVSEFESTRPSHFNLRTFGSYLIDESVSSKKEKLELNISSDEIKCKKD